MFVFSLVRGPLMSAVIGYAEYTRVVLKRFRSSPLKLRLNDGMEVSVLLFFCPKVYSTQGLLLLLERNPNRIIEYYSITSEQ